MSGDERESCLDVICSDVERESDNWNGSARVQRFEMSADRPCAWVLPMLLGKQIDDSLRSRVRRTLTLALTHAINEVRTYAAWGIGRHLWTIDRELALHCVNALATEATLVEEAIKADRSRPYNERRKVDDIEAEAAAVVRRRFFEVGQIAENAHQVMDPTSWFGAEADKHILAILSQIPTDPVAIAAFERIAHTLVGWWDVDDEPRGNRNKLRDERNHWTESSLSDLLQDFLLRTSVTPAAKILQPILHAVDPHPREVYWVLQGLISAEDRRPSTLQFWSLWELFADRVRRATWLTRIDDEYASGNEILSAIFLGSSWKDGVRHWRSLEGHAHHVHALFDDLPPTSTVLDDYLRFLFHIGEQSLPEAFIRIAKRLQQGIPLQMMRKGNTVFLLEVLLQRYVYGRPLELKRQNDLRQAVLFLLDQLVENGSSAAFRMRDDFVTPLSTS
jgi:hypothetical protein